MVMLDAGGVSDTKQIVRASNGTFARGTNTGGRHRGLAARVRERCGNDIDMVIDAQIAIAKGQKPNGCNDFPLPRYSDMTKAAEWIGDRGWGKPLQHVEIAPQVTIDGADIAKLSPAELDEMIAKAEAELAAAIEDQEAEDTDGNVQGPESGTGEAGPAQD